jgi:hypothetical protein
MSSITGTKYSRVSVRCPDHPSEEIQTLYVIDDGRVFSQGVSPRLGSYNARQMSESFSGGAVSIEGFKWGHRYSPLSPESETVGRNGAVNLHHECGFTREVSRSGLEAAGRNARAQGFKRITVTRDGVFEPLDGVGDVRALRGRYVGANGRVTSGTNGMQRSRVAQ